MNVTAIGATKAVAGLFLAISLLGCGTASTTNLKKEDARQADSSNLLSTETTFGEQVENIRQGNGSTILVEKSAVNETELELVRELSGLQSLLLDHPQCQISPAGIELLKDCRNLTHLRIYSSQIDDLALEKIAELQSLRIVNLPLGTYSDVGLAKLAGLPHLVQLRLGSRQITDTGVISLETFPRLTQVHLIGVKITDAALEVFTRMDRLESLYLDEVPVSDVALEKLFAARPQLHVHLNQLHHDKDPHAHPH